MSSLFDVSNVFDVFDTSAFYALKGVAHPHKRASAASVRPCAGERGGRREGAAERAPTGGERQKPPFRWLHTTGFSTVDKRRCVKVGTPKQINLRKCPNTSEHHIFQNYKEKSEKILIVNVDFPANLVSSVHICAREPSIANCEHLRPSRPQSKPHG